MAGGESEEKEGPEQAFRQGYGQRRRGGGGGRGWGQEEGVEKQHD